MIYKYTKCESVIAKIMADADLGEAHFRVTDIKEWIFEAIEKIGAPMQYIKKETGPIKLDGYQIPIPDDLNSLSTVAYSRSAKGQYIVVRSSNSSFREHPDTRSHKNISEINGITIADDEIMERPMSSQSQLYDVNLSRYYLNSLSDLQKGDVTFFVKPGWIVLNRKDGFVKLAYKAIATDEKGYPIIPDTASYQEAIYWYVMMKLSFPKFLRGKLGGKGVNSSASVYNYIQQQWNFYRNQAYAEAMMPTESDMISIKNEWTKLIPDWDGDENLFRSTGEKQLNYTDYYYGY